MTPEAKGLTEPGFTPSFPADSRPPATCPALRRPHAGDGGRARRAPPPPSPQPLRQVRGGCGRGPGCTCVREKTPDRLLRSLMAGLRQPPPPAHRPFKLPVKREPGLRRAGARPEAAVGGVCPAPLLSSGGRGAPRPLSSRAPGFVFFVLPHPTPRTGAAPGAGGGPTKPAGLRSRLAAAPGRAGRGLPALTPLLRPSRQFPPWLRLCPRRDGERRREGEREGRGGKAREASGPRRSFRDGGRRCRSPGAAGAGERPSRGPAGREVSSGRLRSAPRGNAVPPPLGRQAGVGGVCVCVGEWHTLLPRGARDGASGEAGTSGREG